MITVIGWIVSPIIVLLLGWIVTSLKSNKTENKCLKAGVQALLRDRLLQSYTYFEKQGYVDLNERENWVNMYEQYHTLGANGAMDDIHNKFLSLPITKKGSK